ncbi:hypothetical protein IU448_23955 [Nocardia flavorosea]|uniref:hypothetical protein n=1 Tax=Nocardia flavorosea TaxID=53429 RepID=UPI001893DF12|nr:hypothetical protein [Nocardia flavorosea]MBF6352045.1 hypothetical protein [Nocardia flavorosea]
MGVDPGLDRCRAVALALRRDLCHFEIGLRNSYDRVLRAHWTRPGDWTDDPNPTFPPLWRSRGRGANRTRVDINKKNRDLLANAREKAGGATAPSGKVVAELNFGFWRYLTSAAHESTLWVPILHKAFPAGTDRARDVDKPIAKLHDFRNRIAHHEPLLRTDLLARVQDVAGLATMLNADLGTYIDHTTQVRRIAATKP